MRSPLKTTTKNMIRGWILLLLPVVGYYGFTSLLESVIVTYTGFDSLASVLISQVIALIPVCLIYHYAASAEDSKKAEHIVSNAVVAVPLAAVIGIISFNLQLTGGDAEYPELTMTSILLFCIIVPLTEELLFRGYLIRQGERLIGSRNAAALSVVLFSVPHQSIPLIIGAVILSLVASLLYIKSKRIEVPVILHSCVNLCVLFLGNNNINIRSAVIIVCLLLFMMLIYRNNIWRFACNDYR